MKIFFYTPNPNWCETPCRWGIYLDLLWGFIPSIFDRWYSAIVDTKFWTFFLCNCRMHIANMYTTSDQNTDETFNIMSHLDPLSTGIVSLRANLSSPNLSLKKSFGVTFGGRLSWVWDHFKFGLVMSSEGVCHEFYTLQ
jgi:hypothetical protein